MLTSKLIDGTFPDYGRVIPQNNDKEMLVERDEFKAAVEMSGNALKDTEADIQAFQTDKQRKLNQLLVVVTLQMRQVQHLTMCQKLN